MAKKAGPGFKEEIIGLTVKIVGARNNALQGLTGKVVDETMNTIVINDNGREITILKDQIIKLDLIELGIRLDGRLLQGRPEERIKR